MKLDQPFYRLPLRFDAAQLVREVTQFSESEWRAHPQAHPGNTALPLLAVHGDPSNDETRGPMRPTPFLARCPYLRQVLASLDAPIGRTRLMRIAGRSEAVPHVDTNYYWSQRVRVHVPIVTYPGVRFICGESEVFMAAGESWIFDTWRPHNVINPDERPRIHLVIDSAGSPAFWDKVYGASSPRTVSFDQSLEPRFETEVRNFPVVMAPEEARKLLDVISSDLAPTADKSAFAEIQKRFLEEWSALWARLGEVPDPQYVRAIEQLQRRLAPMAGRLPLTNQVDATTAVEHWIARSAVAGTETRRHEPGAFDRPVFIVASPRSGSTLLFETLAQAPDVFTPGGESHAIIEGIAELTPAAHDFASNRLTAEDATPAVVQRLHESLRAQLHDRDGRPPSSTPIRLLEKTPKNALRIPFLAAAFPDALFIYLYREPHENLASIMEAWKSGRFVTYPHLPGWGGPPWSLLLIPEWQQLDGAPLEQIAAAQWDEANRQILDDLAALPHDRWCTITYADFLAQPQREIERLARFAGFHWDRALSGGLPLARHTVTAPHPDKWRKHAAEIEPLLPALAETAQRARESCRREVPNESPPQPSPSLRAQRAARSVPGRGPSGGATDQTLESVSPAHVENLNPDGSRHDTAPSPERSARLFARGERGRVGEGTHTATADAPMRSVHTTSFPTILRELGASVFVSTYQAGKLVVLRADGEVLNTHFRNFPKPMGLAMHGHRLAIGTELDVREFRNVPAVAKRLSSPDKHDAVFLPRSAHVTGDVQIHDLAFAGDELWFVNTAFSCLCTLAPDYSFVPRWRPRFISGLTPEDRCHLNGLAVADGKPRYVTALGESDAPRGWRERKRDGGVLIDIETNEVLLRGLSMPHSPRWHQGRLWLLNSGVGGLGDLEDGRYREVARVPGFTRGLDFLGRYAFIGLSQVRESAVFSGIAIADLPVSERCCGVWVVDTQTGRIVAFTKFEDAVQEIFAVQVAAGLRLPDILTDDKDVISHSFVLPDAALEAVPAHLR